MRKRKLPWAIVAVLFVITFLLAIMVVIAAIKSTGRKKDREENPTAETVPSGEVESETLPTEPKGEILKFVDAHDNWYEVEIDPGVEKHPYDLTRFYNDQTVCSYEDDVYSSRLGIDVSAHQGEIYWQDVADSGIEFAFVRVGYRGYGPEGTLVYDDWATDNIYNAQAAGIDVGVYFFSQAVNEEEAVEEADFVLSLLNQMELQLPVVFDSENILDDDARTDNVSGEQFTKNAIAFCKRINEAGYNAAIYSNMKWEAFTYDLKQLAEYPIWYADYEPLPQTPYRFTWWQYSEKGYVNGIDGEVDLDIEIFRK